MEAQTHSLVAFPPEGQQSRAVAVWLDCGDLGLQVQVGGAILQAPGAMLRRLDIFLIRF